MEDLLRNARLVLRGMWLYRWLGITVAWVAGLIAVVVIFSIPDKYEASARIYVDTDSVLKPLMSGLIVQANTEQQIAMLSRTLISRPNIEKLVRMADLDLGLDTATGKEALVDHLTKKLQIRGVGRDNLYTLEYRDISPDRARKVVQSLTTIFIESSLGTKNSDADSARKFVEEQIRSYQQKLEDAEARLKDFKLKNIEMQLDSGKASTERISEIGNQLSQARLQLREAEFSRDAIKRQLAGEEPVLLPDVPGMESSVSIPEIDGRIETQKRNLDVLLQRYTEQHPDVVGARRIVADLEEQKRLEVAARKKAAKASPVMRSINANPAYQQMKVSFTEAEAMVASLQARVAEYESRYRRGIESMRISPQIEAEFAQLNRDYDVLKKNYDNLVQRREAASISEGMSAVSGVADFRLIDPPRASSKPVEPNRIVFLALALVASIGLGLASSFVASQLRPTFIDAHTLHEIIGLPLLGTVSRTLTPAVTRVRRRNRLMAVAGLGALVVFYGIALAVAFFIISQTTA